MNKTVLITGASSGIGYEFAKIFAGNNYNLVLVARRNENLIQLSQSLPQVKTEVIAMDLSVENAPQKLFEILQSKKIQVDVLINNAGFGDHGFFHETEWNKQAMMIDLNIKALTELTYLFGKEMVKRKAGKILNVSSTAAFQPGPKMSVYYASKSYVQSFSEALHVEWKKFGVSVTALCPGPTESGFQQSANIAGTKLISSTKMSSSLAVAKYGYKILMQNKSSGIQGMSNKVLAFSTRFVPRILAARIAFYLHQDK